MSTTVLRIKKGKKKKKKPSEMRAASLTFLYLFLWQKPSVFKPKFGGV